MRSPNAIDDDWTGGCLARANRRAWTFLGLAVGSALLLVLSWRWLDSTWVFVLIPLCIELAVPGLRHFFSRSTMRKLMQEQTWHVVATRFVPGRARVGRQAYLEMAGYDRSYLRVSGMPERVRDHVRRSGQLWLAGPDERGRTVVVTEQRPFLTLGRVVVR